MNKKNFFLLLVIALFFGNILSAQEAVPPLKPIQKEAIKKAIESGEIDKATVEKLKEKVEKEKSEEQVEKEKGKEEEEKVKVTTREIIPAKVELSPLEKMFGEKISLTVSRNIMQFGYDAFRFPSTTFAPVENVPVGPDYVLGVGDNLIIYIWGKIVQETFSAIVDRDGKINLPRAGNVYVWGLKFSEAEELIKKMLSEHYANFQISITMGKLRTIKVFILGEVKRPGGYTVSSLSTLFHGLYEAGGPTKLGSLRKIKLIRDNKTFDTVDLYKFLLEGDKTQDHRLQSNDTIFVPSIGQVAGIAGNVKKPGIYELLGPTKISDIIKMSGGIAPIGYLNRLQLERIQAHKKRIVLDLEFKSFEDIENSEQNIFLQDGDLILIYPILPYKYNYVTIEGNVLRPGEYELTEGMRISDLIAKAEGVLPESYLKRAEILRFKSDYTREAIPFNLGALLKGDETQDLPLQEWDIVKISSVYDIYPEPMLEIEGSVNKPGRYRFVEGMKISDLLFRGGNPSKEAYLERAELFRFRKDKTRETIPVNLRKILAGDKEENLPLKGWDKLVVYSLYDILPTGFVSIEGEVYKPGNYELTKGMRINDLIFQAKGLRKEAYLERAELFRFRKDKTREMIPVDLNKVLEEDETQNLLLREKDMLRVYSIAEVIPKTYVEISGMVYKPGRYELTTGMRISDLIFRGGGLKRMASLENVELYRQTPGEFPKIISINLSKILKEETSEENLLLEESDHLFIKPNQEWTERKTVTISGEVKFPGTYIVTKGERLSDVLKRAGGFTENAFLKGAIFTRESVKDIQNKRIQEFINSQRQILLREQTALVTLPEEQKAERMEILKRREELISLISKMEVPGRIVIQLLPLPDLVNTRNNILLEDGDKLYIPQIPESITVIGSVRNPTSVLYKPGERVEYYIEKVGGLTKYADKKEIYIVEPDGQAIRELAKMKGREVSRGATIVVPEEFKYRTPPGILIKDATQTIYQMALSAAAIATLQQ